MPDAISFAGAKGNRVLGSARGRVGQVGSVKSQRSGVRGHARVRSCCWAAIGSQRLGRVGEVAPGRSRRVRGLKSGARGLGQRSGVRVRGQGQGSEARGQVRSCLWADSVAPG